MTTAPRLLQRIMGRFGYRVEPLPEADPYPMLRPIDRNGVDILADPAFQASCRAVDGFTLLDTPRLAHLWMYARLSNPAGAMMEIGSYKGGGAFHLTQACPGRRVIVCDPFTRESFETVDTSLDQRFKKGDFADSSEALVRNLLRDAPHEIIPGYFPSSAARRTLPPISFVHLDVDVYRAIFESLAHLLDNVQLLNPSFIIVDDYQRGATGVDKAIHEVLSSRSEFKVLPLFPGQALILQS